MKKYNYTFLILLFTILTFKVSAQQGYHVYKEALAKDIQRPTNNERIFYDTLKPASEDSLNFGFCGDTIKIYELNNPGFGYIGGNNSHGDK